MRQLCIEALKKRDFETASIFKGLIDNATKQLEVIGRYRSELMAHITGLKEELATVRRQKI
jgi:hypothetical protein